MKIHRNNITWAQLKPCFFCWKDKITTVHEWNVSMNCKSNRLLWKKIPKRCHFKMAHITHKVITIACTNLTVSSEMIRIINFYTSNNAKRGSKFQQFFIWAFHQQLWISTQIVKNGDTFVKWNWKQFLEFRMNFHFINLRFTFIRRHF